MDSNRSGSQSSHLPEFVCSMSPELDIEAVVRWINDLPMANAPKVCETIQVLLSSLNTRPIVASSHYAILDALWPVLKIVSPVLDTHFMERGFPLDTHPRKMANLSLQCYVELYKNYKRIADDIAFADDQVLTKNQRVITLFRALYACKLAQTRIAQLYEGPFTDFWKDIYDIFLKAESMGLVDESIEASEAIDCGSSAIANLFKCILLFSLSSPNRYRQRHHAQISALIEQFVELTEIRECAVDNGRKATFFFDLADDSAPRHISHMDNGVIHNARFVYTRTMVEEIVANVQSLSPSEPNNLLCQLDRSLIFRVVRSLGAPERRKSMRVSENDNRALLIGMRSIVDAIIDSKSRETARSDKTHGFDASHNVFTERDNTEKEVFENNLQDSPLSKVYQYGSGESSRLVAKVKPINVPDYGLMPVDDGWEMQNFEVGRGETRSESDMARWFGKPTQEKITCDDIWGDTSETISYSDTPVKLRETSDSMGKMINSSVTGYSMVWLDNGEAKIKVGELIGFPSDDNRFELGTVCWIFNSEGGDLSFGIELLSPSADVVKVNDSSDSNAFAYGILLAEISATEEGTNILLPPSNQKTIDPYAIRFDGSLAQFRLGKLVDSTGAYNRFSLVKEINRNQVDLESA